MHTNDMRAFKDGDCDRAGRCVSAFLYWLLHQSTEELFARQSCEYWIPKVRQQREISQQLKVMLLKLTKTEPRVKNDLTSADPLLDRPVRSFA